MTTALDTNVLSALWNDNDTLNRAARKALQDSQKKGPMVICGLVYAELLAAAGRTEGFVDRFCEEAGIAVERELKEKIWRTAVVAFQECAARKKQSASRPRRLLADS
ncbi:MAG TPA: PIN domain-containing protein [Candidatus Dormibacteraeota bacterium]|nr:PIN domain-containing protein [Candidatus Dormibacteraeota bacterium]